MVVPRLWQGHMWNPGAALVYLLHKGEKCVAMIRTDLHHFSADDRCTTTYYILLLETQTLGEEVFSHQQQHIQIETIELSKLYILM